MGRGIFFRDHDLIERIRANDREVLADLFIRYRKLVFGHVLRHGGDEHDAEDMLQEAIIVLWQKAASPDFELTARLSTYLLAVAKNKWLAVLRKRKRISDVPLDAETPGDEPDALDRVLDAETQSRIQVALAAITPVCREMLLLFYFEERSFEEIAAMMGFANARTAKSKKYQCKKALERVMIADSTRGAGTGEHTQDDMQP